MRDEIAVGSGDDDFANATDIMLDGGDLEAAQESFVRGLFAGVLGIEGGTAQKGESKSLRAGEQRDQSRPIEDEAKDGIDVGAFLGKMKEMRGIYNVTFNDKKSTVIRKI